MTVACVGKHAFIFLLSIDRQCVVVLTLMSLIAHKHIHSELTFCESVLCILIRLFKRVHDWSFYETHRSFIYNWKGLLFVKHVCLWECQFWMNILLQGSILCWNKKKKAINTLQKIANPYGMRIKKMQNTKCKNKRAYL